MCGDARKVAISLCTVTRSTAAHLAPFILLSSGRCLRLAGPALFFDKLRSDKNREEHNESRFRVDLRS